MSKHFKIGIVLLGVLGALLAIPSINHIFFEIIGLFQSVDTHALKLYILSFGVWAPLISFFLMLFQSIIAPLPAFLITFANAGLFGWVYGALLSWVSAMAGAILCFYIAKFLGREVVEKLTSKMALQSVDTFFEKHGVYAILIARLLPFISFDVVSYAAGLTQMRLRSFILATGLGQLPATLIYSYAGEMLSGGTQTFVFGLLILFALSILIFLLKRMFASKNDVHAGVKFHQKNSFSKTFSTQMRFSEGEFKHMAFMPGCALSSYSPQLTHKVYSFLRTKLSGIGIIQQCCGTPTRMIGDTEQFKIYHSILEADLEKMGVDTVVTACENCYMSIKKYAPHIKIISLYEVLADIGLPKELVNAYIDSPKVALHDPCPTRQQRQLHSAVRKLLGELGLSFEEFALNREKTQCCGSKKLLESNNPDLAHAQMHGRAHQTQCADIVSYCQSCAESMNKGGKNGLHLLELIFIPKFPMKQPKVGVVQKWYNRYISRKIIDKLKDAPLKN